MLKKAGVLAVVVLVWRYPHETAAHLIALAEAAGMAATGGWQAFMHLIESL
jgi:hypothetical protein